MPKLMKVMTPEESMIIYNIIPNKVYDVVRTEIIGDDGLYIIIDETGNEYALIDMLAVDV